MTLSYDPVAMRQRLRKALKDKGLSERKASLDSGLSYTYLNGVIEIGREPSVANLLQVCETLEVSLYWLVFGFEISPEAEEVVQIVAADPAKLRALITLLRE